MIIIIRHDFIIFNSYKWLLHGNSAILIALPEAIASDLQRFVLSLLVVGLFFTSFSYVKISIAKFLVVGCSCRLGNRPNGCCLFPVDWFDQLDAVLSLFVLQNVFSNVLEFS